jgi:GT2 family glycosyltransferase
VVLIRGPVADPTFLPPSSIRVRASGKFFHLAGSQWLLKGLTYGPFDGTDLLPEMGQVDRDLQHITSLGCNTLRLYTPPPRWFLDACAAAGLHVLVGWPWPSHTDFLRSSRGRHEIIERARTVVRSLRGSPAVLGFLVGNEVPADLVRWMGPDRVRKFLDRLIAAGREEDPDALFAYASYPTTEYLNPVTADFVVANIYLEDRHAFTRYLARLQLVAGDLPLVVGEFGLDSRRHGEARQAETLSWAWGAALRAGLAGQVIFSFTDEWFNDGRRMDPEWEFGVTAASREPKAACAALSALLPSLRRAGQGVRLHRLPRFSVIICTFNGARTLRRALDSVQHLPYPDYEVVLVDDGSADPAVAAIAAEYREVRSYRISHGGLSRARNFGAAQASGGLLVYLDDDAAAEGDWLTFLAQAFEDDRVGAAGGPNIPPPAQGWKVASLSVAPGGPAVVMLNDTEAEHVPGCNLAVTRAAWEAVGGFDERHETAGDDVDFCWRLIQHGYKIVYHPGAMVWHERRGTVRGYFRQQMGYGRAEAALIAQHPHRFASLGGARWHGVVYDPAVRAAASGGCLYGGPWGTAPYQFLYAVPAGPLAALATSAPWMVAAAGFLLAGFWHPAALISGAGLLLVPLFLAIRAARVLPLPRWPGQNRASTLAARLLLGALAFLQPPLRGLVREIGCFRQRLHPQAPWRLRPHSLAQKPRLRKAVAELCLWNEQGLDRATLLRAVLADLQQAHWPVISGDNWQPWDMEINGGLGWSIRLVTATEFHPAKGTLIRVRLHSRAHRWVVACAALCCLLVPAFFAVRTGWGLWALAVSFLLWLGLEHLHGSGSTRILRLVLAASRRLGLQSVDTHPPPGGHQTS